MNIAQELQVIVNDLLEKMQLNQGELFVLGCSTSEVVGGVIGKQSNLEVAEMIVTTLRKCLNERGIALAVQCCEHLNRALVIEKSDAMRYGYEVVMVEPVAHAGGAAATVAYQQFSDPVVVEFVQARAGMDIGDTSIGMHVRHVQVPIRPIHRTIGQAHVTALTSRPKYIGGPRASYPVI